MVPSETGEFREWRETIPIIHRPSSWISWICLDEIVVSRLGLKLKGIGLSGNACHGVVLQSGASVPDGSSLITPETTPPSIPTNPTTGRKQLASRGFEKRNHHGRGIARSERTSICFLGRDRPLSGLEPGAARALS